MSTNKIHGYNTKYLLKILILFFISFILINIYTAAFADSTTDPIGTQLCSVLTVLSGGIAKAVAITALMFMGIGLFMGKVNWGVAITTAIGVIILFGAPKMVGFLGGTTVDGTTCVKSVT